MEEINFRAKVNTEAVRPLDEPSESPASIAEQTLEFYEHATADYEHWSRGFNMHLGYYKQWSNPFNREQMVEQANVEVAKRLRLDQAQDPLLFDLGCGAGAVSRTIARLHPTAQIKGVTISPLQVRLANDLNTAAGLGKRIDIFKGNYTSLPVKGGTVDGAWAVESACHASGSAKEDLIREAARILKPGGRFVIADCFLKTPSTALNPIVGRCYRSLCHNWALTELGVIGDFTGALENNGFTDVIVEEISWNIAPSVMHAPTAVATFIIKKLVSREHLGPHSINNLKASLLAMVLGSNRSKFGYYLVSGKKR